jgi:hypothetical protein
VCTLFNGAGIEKILEKWENETKVGIDYYYYSSVLFFLSS